METLAILVLMATKKSEQLASMQRIFKQSLHWHLVLALQIGLKQQIHLKKI
jgi:hypothetical protein